MAITIGPAGGSHADNGSSALDPHSFNIGDATNGDLIFLFAWKRTATGAISIGNTGGQTWNSFTTQNCSTATLSANVFWCVFNSAGNGQGDVVFNATTNNSFYSIYFHPTSSSNSWAVDPSKTGVFTDRAAAASFTETGWTPTNASNVSIVAWCTQDDNTWGTLTGTNWTKTGLIAQLRNIAGNDTSATFAYQIQTAAAGTNNVAQTQLTNGNDAGLTFAITFYEFTPAAPTTKSFAALGVG